MQVSPAVRGHPFLDDKSIIKDNLELRGEIFLEHFRLANWPPAAGKNPLDSIWLSFSSGSIPRLLVEFHLDAVVQGGGDLVDMLEVGRQQRIEVHTFTARDGMPGEQWPKCPPIPRAWGWMHWVSLTLDPDLHHRGFQPDGLAVCECP